MVGTSIKMVGAIKKNVCQDLVQFWDGLSCLGMSDRCRRITTRETGQGNYVLLVHILHSIFTFSGVCALFQTGHVHSRTCSEHRHLQKHKYLRGGKYSHINII